MSEDSTLSEMWSFWTEMLAMMEKGNEIVFPWALETARKQSQLDLTPRRGMFGLTTGMGGRDQGFRVSGLCLA